MLGILCSPRLYEYEGLIIEESGCQGPWPVKKNGDPYERRTKAQHETMEKFWALKEEGWKQYLIGGGCREIY
jgi:hypothetical protein